MSNIAKLRDQYIEVNFEGQPSLEKRIQQIRKIINIVIHTRKMHLLINMKGGSGIFNNEDTRKVIDFIHKEDWSLRNRRTFIKVAVYSTEIPVEEFDLHMKILKAKDIQNVHFFGSRQAALDWLDIKTSLDDVTAFYQPIVKLTTGEIIGYEALARKIKDNNTMPTKAWLPKVLNEKDGPLMLTEKMLALASKQVRNLNDKQFISVNFEADNFNCKDLTRLLTPYVKSPFKKHLVVEICESGQLNNNCLKELEGTPIPDIRLSLDDIGSGASRFLIMAEARPYAIKLDQVVSEQLSNQDVFEFVCYFTKWAHQTGTMIVAEGVENQEIADRCIAAGIDYAQGIHFYEPAKKLISKQEK
ncbi:EAL domain-containing protein [Thalassotalea sp. LPB0316]|uniref:EAL domain-containing protein n=1 Tax=Thalassotalea sp. LPB0316 TaxID=2769490 RepID=UPI001865B8C1|nr:EAL domain-containing protein [Thalassotalea sp. LPB0316]QOL25855.1 EAL domain-containing protein [Thalassotalea sp. LPB0316]